MRDLMRQVVNRTYTFQVNVEDPVLVDSMGRFLAEALQWDEPVFAETFVGGHG